jgi:RNA polymerase II-associated factor 1
MRVVSEVVFSVSAKAHIFATLAIQAPSHTPAPHPHDRPLLRPLSTLGKPKFSDTGVSVLRRTEYISSHTSKSRFDSTTSKSLIGNTGNRIKRPPTNIDKESPEYIKSQVEKSFQAAASNLKEGKSIRHPSNRNLKLVDSYPLVPDLDAFPDAGGYITIKFLTNPVPPSSTYDIRLENSLLRPVPPTEEEQLAKQAAKEAYELDPERNPAPNETIEYEFFMTETPEEALKFKRKFDALDPEKDEEGLYSGSNGAGNGCFRFKRIRPYESASQTGSVIDKYDDEVMIAIHDGSDGLREKAAYYYPILQRTAIRPQRTKNIHKHRLGFTSRDEDGKTTDYVDMQIEDPMDDMVAAREVFREHPYGKEDQPDDDDEASGEGNGEANGETNGKVNGGANGTDKESQTPEPKNRDED